MLKENPPLATLRSKLFSIWNTILLSETLRDRYQIVHMGWHHDRRVHQCVMHIDIRNGKIWILHNTTEHELDLELMELGVPKSDIVLGLHPPELRQFTGYAVR
jgi:hypothetical protein